MGAARTALLIRRARCQMVACVDAFSGGMLAQSLQGLLNLPQRIPIVSAF